MRYTEHPLAKKLKDSSIYDYKPEWTKNNNILRLNHVYFFILCP